jgi:predicted nucleic acid-binding protein
VIVVDAGVVVDLLAGDLDPDVLGDDVLAAPHLVDSEVVNAVRKLVIAGALTEAQGDAAVEGFGELVLDRYPAHGLRRRMWGLRHNLSAYDATYAALAEALGADALLTTDRALAGAPGLRCRVRLA